MILKRLETYPRANRSLCSSTANLLEHFPLKPAHRKALEAAGIEFLSQPSGSVNLAQVIRSSSIPMPTRRSPLRSSSLGLPTKRSTGSPNCLCMLPLSPRIRLAPAVGFDVTAGALTNAPLAEYRQHMMPRRRTSPTRVPPARFLRLPSAGGDKTLSEAH